MSQLISGGAFFVCVYNEPGTDLCLHKNLYRKNMDDKRFTPLPSENADNPCRSSSVHPR